MIKYKLLNKYVHNAVDYWAAYDSQKNFGL
jgi:hypothetical protein